MAAALDVALSGPRSYGGTPTDDPVVHPEGRRDPGPETVDAAVAALWRGWGVALTGAALIAVA